MIDFIDAVIIMKIFSAKNPNYYIQLDGQNVNTQLLKQAIFDSSSKEIRHELKDKLDVESLHDFLLTFNIDHPYAKWLEQYIPFINIYLSQEVDEDIKLPDFGYWKNHPFKKLEEPKKDTDSLKLLRINESQTGDFVSIDVESTGVVPEVDRIIQVGAVKYQNGKVIDTFNSYIRPDNFDQRSSKYYLSDNIVDITGIKDADIQDAPLFKEVFDKFLKFIEGEIVIGHNVIFDINIISAELRRNKMKIPNIQYYDTLVEARELMAFQPRGGYRLEVLKEKINMGHLDSHDALNDCYIAGELFNHLNQLV